MTQIPENKKRWNILMLVIGLFGVSAGVGYELNTLYYGGLFFLLVGIVFSYLDKRN